MGPVIAKIAADAASSALSKAGDAQQQQPAAGQKPPVDLTKVSINGNTQTQAQQQASSPAAAQPTEKELAYEAVFKLIRQQTQQQAGSGPSVTDAAKALAEQQELARLRDEQMRSSLRTDLTKSTHEDIGKMLADMQAKQQAEIENAKKGFEQALAAERQKIADERAKFDAERAKAEAVTKEQAAQMTRDAIAEFMQHQKKLDALKGMGLDQVNAERILNSIKDEELLKMMPDIFSVKGKTTAAGGPAAAPVQQQQPVTQPFDPVRNFHAPPPSNNPAYQNPSMANQQQQPPPIGNTNLRLMPGMDPSTAIHPQMKALLNAAPRFKNSAIVTDPAIANVYNRLFAARDQPNVSVTDR